MNVVITTPTERAATGVYGLDDILNGGFPRDRLYLLEGNPGSGKTTLGLQFLREGVRLQQRCMYVTLSETKEELSAVAASHGWGLEGIHVYELQNLGVTAAEADAQYSFFLPSEVELGQTTKAVLDQIAQYNPQRIIFDSLSELRLLARDSLRYRRQILGLKHFFIGRGATVLLLDDRTSEGYDLQLQSLAHGVIFLEQMSPEFGTDRRRLRVIKMRGSKYRGGYHDFSIEKGGLKVYPRLIAAEHRTSFEEEIISSGLSELDQLFHGGIPKGSSTLITGPAGAGKSSLAIQYCLEALKRGEKASVFAFDEGMSTLINRTLGFGIDLAKWIKTGQLAIRQIDPAELSPGEFMHMVRDAVEEHGSSVVVIDSLNGYLNAMPEERFLVIQMHELLSYLSQQGVLSFLVVAQHGLVGISSENQIQVSYLADSVILLRYFEALGEVKRAISVVKKRSGGHETTIRELIIDNKGPRIGPPLKNFSGILTGVPRQVKP